MMGHNQPEGVQFPMTWVWSWKRHIMVNIIYTAIRGETINIYMITTPLVWRMKTMEWSLP